MMMSVGGLKKDFQSRHKHRIDFSRRRAMAGLAFFSLLLVAVMVSTASAQGGLPSCCLKLGKTKVHRDQLKSYYVQLTTTQCTKKAVVFTTVKDKRICSHPEESWTKNSMAYLDKKRATTQIRLK
ncbi:C-C motif chemokine 12-like [Pungitius pungitius]|uniref:C-C motif chemokine 12-like n=1 Tax=Pungitius pungitius TaxID=134920 RepID=UPI002E0F8AC8